MINAGGIGLFHMRLVALQYLLFYFVIFDYIMSDL